MKISVGMHLKEGPWGGGNQFGKSLKAYLEKKGHEVFFDLKEKDLEFIMLTEPRAHLKISAYTDQEIFHYLRHVNPKALVVHRVNECDQRKGTEHVDTRLKTASLCADQVVFISHWLEGYFKARDGTRLPSRVILNGADTHVFHPNGRGRWTGKEKLKIVTHHWGAGRLKGFDVYQRLDELLSQSPFRDQVAFTYIGNLPKDFKFLYAKHIEPQNGAALAESLCQNHVYLTASQHEPAGMHHIEGALCGLPLLYRKSGALPEYCQNFGISFDTENFESKLAEMIQNYTEWAGRMKNYSYTAERMCKNYEDLFVELLSRRDQIIRQRPWWRFPLWKWRGTFS